MFTAARIIQKYAKGIKADAFVPEGNQSFSEEPLSSGVSVKAEIASVPVFASKQKLQTDFCMSGARAFVPDFYFPVPEMRVTLPVTKPLHTIGGKLCVSSAKFDIASGVEGGALYALGTALLMPIDRELTKSAVHATSTKGYFSGLSKLFVERPSFKEAYIGTVYKTKFNIIRNGVMFPVLPLTYDLCHHKWKFSAFASSEIAGLSLGLTDALLSSAKEVVMNQVWVSGKSAEDIEKSLSSKQKQEKMMHAVKYRAMRSVTYWGTVPIMADIFEAQLEHSKLMKLPIFVDIDAPALIGGGVAGFLISLLTHPIELAKAKKINNSSCKVIAPMVECLNRHGVFKGSARVVLEHTHVNFPLACLRVVLASAIFQWCKDQAIKSTQEFLEKDVEGNDCGQSPKPGKRV